MYTEPLQFHLKVQLLGMADLYIPVYTFKSDLVNLWPTRRNAEHQMWCLILYPSSLPLIQKFSVCRSRTHQWIVIQILIIWETDRADLAMCRKGQTSCYLWWSTAVRQYYNHIYPLEFIQVAASKAAFRVSKKSENPCSNTLFSLLLSRVHQPCQPWHTTCHCTTRGLVPPPPSSSPIYSPINWAGQDSSQFTCGSQGLPTESSHHPEDHNSPSSHHILDPPWHPTHHCPPTLHSTYHPSHTPTCLCWIGQRWRKWRPRDGN